MEPRLRHRWVLNLTLAVLAGGLLLVLLWRPGQPPAPAPLTGLAANDITRVVVRQLRQADIELARDQGHWRLVKPVAARLNARVLDQLLRLPSAPVLARPDDAAGLAGFGLDPPRARVFVNHEEIEVGALHPVKGQIYVRHGGRVALVPATHAAAATYPWTRLLDHRLLGEGVALAGLQLPGFRLALQNGTWQRHPADQALSGDRINGFVQEWQQATALAVDPMTRKPALGRITLEIREREQVRRLVLEIVGYQPEFVLRRRDEGLEYHFPEDVGRRLMKLGGE